MQQVIIAIHLMVVTALVILVLYQKSEGGALGMGGGSGVFTGRGQANALTRATGILATIFFITSIALTVLPAWERRSEGGDDWTKSIDQGTIQLKEIPTTEGKDDKARRAGANARARQGQHFRPATARPAEASAERAGRGAARRDNPAGRQSARSNDAAGRDSAGSNAARRAGASSGAGSAGPSR